MIAQLALVATLAAPRDPWIGPDKLKHFFVAAFTQSVTYSVLQLARVRHDRALVGASAVTALVSVTKELHDRHTTGLFSVRDLVWDAAGAAAATALLERSRRRGSDGEEASEGAAAPAPTLRSYVHPRPVLYSTGTRMPLP
jgi:uncharacterized protein YfiM (DUF2279 family)